MLDTKPVTAREEAINEALYDAICDGDGRPRADALARHLAKHGLVIVESSSHDKLLTTLQVVASVLEPIVTDMGAREFPPGVWRALRGIVTKIGEIESGRWEVEEIGD